MSGTWCSWKYLLMMLVFFCFRLDTKCLVDWITKIPDFNSCFKMFFFAPYLYITRPVVVCSFVRGDGVVQGVVPNHEITAVFRAFLMFPDVSEIWVERKTRNGGHGRHEFYFSSTSFIIFENGEKRKIENGEKGFGNEKNSSLKSRGTRLYNFLLDKGLLPSCIKKCTVRKMNKNMEYLKNVVTTEELPRVVFGYRSCPHQKSPIKDLKVSRRPSHDALSVIVILEW